MKVRTGSVYVWVACMLDTLHPSIKRVADGTKVRVVNMKGCPPANTMNHCYAETLDGEWLGLVCCSSLYKAADAERVMAERKVYVECK